MITYWNDWPGSRLVGALVLVTTRSGAAETVSVSLPVLLSGVVSGPFVLSSLAYAELMSVLTPPGIVLASVTFTPIVVLAPEFKLPRLQWIEFPVTVLLPVALLMVSSEGMTSSR